MLIFMRKFKKIIFDFFSLKNLIVILGYLLKIYAIKYYLKTLYLPQEIFIFMPKLIYSRCFVTSGCLLPAPFWCQDFILHFLLKRHKIA